VKSFFIPRCTFFYKPKTFPRSRPRSIFAFTVHIIFFYSSFRRNNGSSVVRVTPQTEDHHCGFPINSPHCKKVLSLYVTSSPFNVFRHPQSPPAFVFSIPQFCSPHPSECLIELYASDVMSGPVPPLPATR